MNRTPAYQTAYSGYGYGDPYGSNQQYSSVPQYASSAYGSAYGFDRARPSHIRSSVPYPSYSGPSSPAATAPLNTTRSAYSSTRGPEPSPYSYGPTYAAPPNTAGYGTFRANTGYTSASPPLYTQPASAPYSYNASPGYAATDYGGTSGYPGSYTRASPYADSYSHTSGGAYSPQPLRYQVRQPQSAMAPRTHSPAPTYSGPYNMGYSSQMPQRPATATPASPMTQPGSAMASMGNRPAQWNEPARGIPTTSRATQGSTSVRQAYIPYRSRPTQRANTHNVGMRPGTAGATMQSGPLSQAGGSVRDAEDTINQFIQNTQTRQGQRGGHVRSQTAEQGQLLQMTQSDFSNVTARPMPRTGMLGHSMQGASQDWDTRSHASYTSVPSNYSTPAQTRSLYKVARGGTPTPGVTQSVRGMPPSKLGQNKGIERSSSNAAAAAALLSTGSPSPHPPISPSPSPVATPPALARSPFPAASPMQPATPTALPRPAPAHQTASSSSGPLKLDAMQPDGLGAGGDVVELCTLLRHVLSLMEMKDNETDMIEGQLHQALLKATKDTLKPVQAGKASQHPRWMGSKKLRKLRLLQGELHRAEDQIATCKDRRQAITRQIYEVWPRAVEFSNNSTALNSTTAYQPPYSEFQAPQQEQAKILSAKGSKDNAIGPVQNTYSGPMAGQAQGGQVQVAEKIKAGEQQAIAAQHQSAQSTSQDSETSESQLTGERVSPVPMTTLSSQNSEIEDVAEKELHPPRPQVMSS